MSDTDDDQTETNEGRGFSIRHAPEYEVTVNIDGGSLPEGISRLLSQIAGAVADVIEDLRENGLEGGGSRDESDEE